MVWKGIILGCLFLAFLLLFRRIKWLEIMRQLLKQTKDTMDEAARQRMLQNRKSLLELQREQSLWMRAEQELQYSGLKRHFPALTAEHFIAGNLLFFGFLFLILEILLSKGWMVVVGMLGVLGIEWGIITILKAQALRSVERNLLKFLDFLGNYSITAGEVTGIFNQVSKYVEEPLKTILDECYFEAQTTGDVSMALLSMAEKVEHPQWKELVRNIEISMRYSADFSMLVQSSRRTVREYLRAASERKNMLREAMVNMMLLLGLSVFVLMIVDGLIETSIWHILLHTLPGKLALAVLTAIFMLFVRQLCKISQ